MEIVLLSALTFKLEATVKQCEPSSILNRHINFNRCGFAFLLQAHNRAVHAQKCVCFDYVDASQAHYNSGISNGNSADIMQRFIADVRSM